MYFSESKLNKERTVNTSKDRNLKTSIESDKIKDININDTWCKCWIRYNKNQHESFFYWWILMKDFKSKLMSETFAESSSTMPVL